MRIPILRLGGPGVLFAAASVPLPPLAAQQIIDTTFRVPIEKPAFPLNRAPLVLIDQAHFNAVDSTRYRPAMSLLRQDGYVVEPLRGPLTHTALARARVLVSFLYGTSARAGINLLRQANPGVTKVGAFTEAEVAAL